MGPNKALKLFKVLKDKWGVNRYGYDWDPAGSRFTQERDIRYTCNWMSELKEDYHRPTFEEFLQLYKIELEVA